MTPGRKCQIPNPNPQNAQSSTLHFNGLVLSNLSFLTAQIKQEVLEDQEAYFQPELKPKIEPLDYNIQGELSNFEQQ